MGYIIENKVIGYFFELRTQCEAQGRCRKYVFE